MSALTGERPGPAANTCAAWVLPSALAVHSWEHFPAAGRREGALHSTVASAVPEPLLRPVSCRCDVSARTSGACPVTPCLRTRDSEPSAGFRAVRRFLLQSRLSLIAAVAPENSQDGSPFLHGALPAAIYSLPEVHLRTS